MENFVGAAQFGRPRFTGEKRKEINNKNTKWYE
jgi:hypothetical protein